VRTLAVISTGIISTGIIIGAVASGAGAPPDHDVRISCRAADRVSIAAPGTDKAHNDMQACLDDERIAGKQNLGELPCGLADAVRRHEPHRRTAELRGNADLPGVMSGTASRVSARRHCRRPP
jgi:transcription initiation factor TFIID subunit TAF12